MFRKYAKAQILSFADNSKIKTAGKTQKLSGFEYEPRNDGHKYMYVAVRACTADVPNLNYDMLPDRELGGLEKYKTFEGAYVYLNHDNTDPAKARGAIIAARYHEEGDEEGHKWVEILEELDEEKCPKLCALIRSGEIDTVSMGCSVTSSTCSICGNEAEYPYEFCEHIQQKGNMFNGKLAYEICNGIDFFECSWVYNPADPTAHVQALEKEVSQTKTASGVQFDEAVDMAEDMLDGRSYDAKDLQHHALMVAVQVGHKLGLPRTQIEELRKALLKRKWAKFASIGFIEQMNNGRYYISCGTMENPEKYFYGSGDTKEDCIEALQSLTPEELGVSVDEDYSPCEKIFELENCFFGERKRDISECTKEVFDGMKTAANMEEPFNFYDLSYDDITLWKDVEDLPSWNDSYEQYYDSCEVWVSASTNIRYAGEVIAEWEWDIAGGGDVYCVDTGGSGLDSYSESDMEEMAESRLLDTAIGEVLLNPAAFESIFNNLGDFISWLKDKKDSDRSSDVYYDIKVARKVAQEYKNNGPEISNFADAPRQPDEVSTHEDQRACPLCGSQVFDGEYCDVCGYQTPPEGFDDIKLEDEDTYEQYEEDRLEQEDTSPNDEEEEMLSHRIGFIC